MLHYGVIMKKNKLIFNIYIYICKNKRTCVEAFGYVIHWSHISEMVGLNLTLGLKAQSGEAKEHLKSVVHLSTNVILN